MPTASGTPPSTTARPHAAVAYVHDVGQPPQFVGHCSGCMWKANEVRDTEAAALKDVAPHLKQS